MKKITITGGKPKLYCREQFLQICNNGYVLEAGFEVRIVEGGGGVEGQGVVKTFAVPGTKITRKYVGSNSMHTPAVTEVEVPN